MAEKKATERMRIERKFVMSGPKWESPHMSTEVCPIYDYFLHLTTVRAIGGIAASCPFLTSFCQSEMGLAIAIAQETGVGTRLVRDCVSLVGTNEDRMVSSSWLLKPATAGLS